MIGPCKQSFEFTHVQAGGFMEVTMRIWSEVDGTLLAEKTERVHPNTTLEIGPFRATIQFGEATVECPLVLYLRDFEGKTVEDFRGDREEHEGNPLNL